MLNIDQKILEKISNYINTTETAQLSAEELKVASSDIHLSTALEFRNLGLLELIEGYYHPDEAIMQQVTQNLDEITWRILFNRLFQYYAYGFVAAVKIYAIEGGIAKVRSLKILHQDVVEFKQKDGKKWVEIDVGEPDPVVIPSEHYFHYCSQEDLLPGGKEPRGIAALSRATKILKLQQICMDAIAVAAQRQATPFLVGKTQTDDLVPVFSGGMPMINPDGSPMLVPRGQAMKEEMMEIENSTVVVINTDDDIVAISQQADIKFFRSLLYYLDTQKFWLCQVSPILFGINESGVGDSSLVEAQAEYLKEKYKAQASAFCDRFVKDVIKPMIIFNFGEQDSYGSFTLKRENKNFLELVKVLIEASSLSGEQGAETISLAIADLRKKIGI